LANAHRAGQNGDYQLARAEYRAVLDSPQTEVERLEAHYGLGLSAVLDGAFEAGRDLLTEFIQDNSEDHRVPPAHFYLAQAYEGLNDYSAAVQHYRLYLDRQDVLADVIYTQIGDDLMLLVDYKGAIQAYQQALEHTTDLGQQYDLREQIGVAYSASGQFDASIKWLESIVRESENVYRLARIWYLIGQVHRMAGREAEALEAYAQAVSGDPRPGYAHAALVALVESYVEVDDYQRGLINYHAGSYAAALAALQRYMDTVPGYDSDAHYYAALSYFESGAYDLASEECERALLKYPDTITHWGELWLIRARALAARDLLDEAVSVLLDFADQNVGHPLAPQARWEAAQLLERDARFADAAQAYTTLADRHVNAEQAASARFRAGLCRYRSADVDGAVLAWRELVLAYPNSTNSARGQYWLARALWEHDQAAEAQEILRDLVDQHPRHYYGLRADDLLANDGAAPGWPPGASNLHWTFEDQLERRRAEDWLQSWAAGSSGQELSSIPTELTDDIRFRRGAELLALGLRAQARDEFDALRQDHSHDPVALYHLATLTRELGLYSSSVRAAISLVTLAPEQSVLEMPPFIQRLSFPVYFADLVLSECQAYSLDPLLMFSLVRQESVFDDKVSSWAGAVGLAQIMPATGEWIAEMMPWPEYASALDLQRAYLNVKFGAWFLDRILGMTDGNIGAALAGYNGGPGNGVYWMEQSGGDLDMLVEIINRDEPRLYIQEIYRHYQVYARLYAAAAD
jgi:soluble lytic murein transglycosylase